MKNISLYKSESSNRYEDMLVTYQLADPKVIEMLSNKYGNKFKAKGARRSMEIFKLYNN